MSSKTLPPSRIVRIARAHRRLGISAVIGVVAYALLTVVFNDSRNVVRLLVGWDLALLFYLLKTARMMARSSAAEIRKHAAGQDEGAFALLVLIVAATIASLGAIFLELAGINTNNSPGYGLYAAHAVATVLLSWTFIHTIFALHYAYEFYGDALCAHGLKFPDDSPPDYWDFIYFSFVIGMTFQVSDVAVTNKFIRRTVVSHGALSFFFTTAVIALAVNIAVNGLSR